MFATLAMTGIRAGELLGLRENDLDFERRLIFIRRSTRWYGCIQTLKSKASQGTLPMDRAPGGDAEERLGNVEAESVWDAVRK